MNKKILQKLFSIVLVIFILNAVVSLIFKYFSGYNSEQYLVLYFFNLFKKTHIETQNFIINIPKFNWIKMDTEDKNVNYFVGLYQEIDNEKIGATITQGDILEFPILDIMREKCDEPLNEVIEMINNWEAETYSCASVDGKKIPSKIIKYKNDIFYLDLFFSDKFKPQYDKFFKGVKLKE